MSFETDFASAVAAYSGVSALIGSRIYHAELRQGSQLPAVVFQRIATSFMHTHSGLNAVRVARVQLDCWAADEAQALSLAAAVIASLETFNLADDQSVPVSFPNLALTQFPLNDREADPPVYRQVLEARIWFRE